jgi:hypothetical protein
MKYAEFWKQAYLTVLAGRSTQTMYTKSEAHNLACEAADMADAAFDARLLALQEEQLPPREPTIVRTPVVKKDGW